MAKMIPKTLAPEVPDSERRLYERFRGKLPHNWIVIHGQRFLLPAEEGRPQRRELDFLILRPTYGALTLEVKGGGIKYSAAGWTTTNRYG